MKRFASHTEEEINAKRQNVVPKNTAKANKAGTNLLRAYLTEKNMESNFESFSAIRMAETLPFLHGHSHKKWGTVQSHYYDEQLACTKQILEKPPSSKKV
jgi:hypothetical protein